MILRPVVTAAAGGAGNVATPREVNPCLTRPFCCRTNPYQPTTMSTAQTEAALGFAALIAFCLLTFGAAWLMATWMRTPPSRWRRSRPDSSAAPAGNSEG